MLLIFVGVVATRSVAVVVAVLVVDCGCNFVYCFTVFCFTGLLLLLSSLFCRCCYDVVLAAVWLLLLYITVAATVSVDVAVVWLLLPSPQSPPL